MPRCRPLLFLLLLMILPPLRVNASGPATMPSPFPGFEQNGATLIREARNRPLVTGKTVEPFSEQRVRETVLERNLAVKLSVVSEQRAAFEHIRTDAYFDPVLDATVNYTHKNTYERTAIIGRIRRQETDFEAMEQKFRDRSDMDMEEREQDFLSTIEPTCVYIDGILINEGECGKKFKYSVEKEAASMELFGDRLPDTVTGEAGISANLAWGQSLRLGLSSQWRENKYPSLGDYAALYKYDEGVDAYPYGNNPWTSTFSFRMETPVPFCKNFGEDGNYNAVLNRASALNAEAQRFNRIAEASDTLAEALHAWWDLAGGVSRLAVITKARTHLESLADRTERQMAAGEATSYAATQVNAELQRWKNMEEEAWSTYLQLSNAMAERLDMDTGTLFFPTGFGAAAPASAPPGSPAAQGLEDTLETARSLRPELKSAGIDLRSKTVWETFRENDLMPDISVSFSCSLSQSPTYWGYDSWTESVMEIIDPDATAFYVGFVYRFPIGNRAAESAYTRSKLERQKSRLRYKQMENDIVREVKQAGTAAETRSRSLEYAVSGNALKMAAYEKATTLREDGLPISEFELLSKFTEYVYAELRLISTAILRKKADIDMLHALGTLLPEDWAKPSEFDPEELAEIMEPPSFEAVDTKPETDGKPATAPVPTPEEIRNLADELGLEPIPDQAEESMPRPDAQEIQDLADELGLEPIQEETP